MKKKLVLTLKTFLSMVLKYSIILIIMSIAGIFLLTLAYSTPVNPVTKESSFGHRDSMGWAPLVNNRYSQYKSFFTSYEPGILDDSTDLIILNNSFDEGEGSAIERAADMNNYGRYWHGYVSILRFILLIIGTFCYTIIFCSFF